MLNVLDSLIKYRMKQKKYHKTVFLLTAALVSKEKEEKVNSGIVFVLI